MKKEIKFKIGQQVKIKKTTWSTTGFEGKIGVVIKIENEKTYLPYLVKVDGIDLWFPEIKLLKSPKKIKKEKPQEKFNWFDVRKEANGWTVKTYKDKAFVFNTKARLVKWIEKNI